MIGGISIAAIPSWRGEFIQFIGKFSPKADENNSAYPYDKPNASLSEVALRNWLRNMEPKDPGNLPSGASILMANDPAANAQKCAYSTMARQIRDSEKCGESVYRNDIPEEAKRNKDNHNFVEYRVTPETASIDINNNDARLSSQIREVVVKGPGVKSVILFDHVSKECLEAGLCKVMYNDHEFQTTSDAADMGIDVKSVDVACQMNWVPTNVPGHEDPNKYDDSYCANTDIPSAFRVWNSDNIEHEIKWGYGLDEVQFSGVGGSDLPIGTYKVIPSSGGFGSLGASNSISYWASPTDYRNYYDDKVIYSGINLGHAIVIGNENMTEMNQGGGKGWADLRYPYKTYPNHLDFEFTPNAYKISDNVYEVDYIPETNPARTSFKTKAVDTNTFLYEIFVKVTNGKGIMQGFWGPLDTCLKGIYPGWQKYGNWLSYQYGDYATDLPGSANIEAMDKSTSCEQNANKNLVLQLVEPRLNMTIDPKAMSKDGFTNMNLDNNNYVLGGDSFGIVNIKAGKIKQKTINETNIEKCSGKGPEELKNQKLIKTNEKCYEESFTEIDNMANYNLGLRTTGYQKNPDGSMSSAEYYVPTTEELNLINNLKTQFQNINDQIEEKEEELTDIENITPEKATKLTNEINNLKLIKESILAQLDPIIEAIKNKEWIQFNWNRPLSDQKKLKSIETKDKGNNQFSEATIFIRTKDELTTQIQTVQSTPSTGATNNYTGYIPSYLASTTDKGVKFVKEIPKDVKVEIKDYCISLNEKQIEQSNLIEDENSLSKNNSKNNWVTRLLDFGKDKLVTILGLNKRVYSENTNKQICGDEIDKADNKNIIFVGNILKFDLKVDIIKPKEILDDYSKIVIKFVQPKGTKINEKAIEDLAKNINQGSINYITYGNWDDAGRNIFIDITSKVKNDQKLDTSLIDNLQIEFEMDEGVSNEFEILYEVIGENKLTHSNLLIKKVYAVKEEIINTSVKKMFKVNKPTSSPSVKIDHIEREIDGKNFNLLNPLEYDEKGNSKLKEGIPSPEDNKLNPNFEQYIKKNNYLDIYKDQDNKWQIKVFPGDKIYYFAEYIPEEDLDYVDLIMGISAQAEDWMCKTGCDGNKYKSDNDKRVLIKSFDKISKTGINETYWIKLKREIPLNSKQIGTYVGIGDWDLNYLYVPSQIISLNDYKQIWQKNDLFGIIKGQIKAADGSPLANIFAGILSNHHIVSTFDQNNLDKYITDKDGYFQLEYDRQKDFPNETKYQLTFSYFNPILKPKRMIKTSELKNSDILYINLKEMDISEKGISDNIAIELNKDNNLIEYPDRNKNLDFYQQVIGASVIWNNINSAFVKVKDDYQINTDEFKNDFSINLLPASNKSEKDLSYYKDDNIFLAYNVWNSAFSNPNNYSSHNQLHEFSHYIMTKIGLKADIVISNSNSEPIDVPYLNQYVMGNDNGCGPTSLSMVFQYYGYNFTPEDVFNSGTNSGTLQNGQMLDRNTVTNSLNSLSELEWKNASSWQDIVNQVKDGNPVVVGTNFASGSGHWMVIVGFTENGDVIVNDPGGDHGNKWSGSQGEFLDPKNRNGQNAVYDITDFHDYFDKSGSVADSHYVVDPPLYLFDANYYGYLNSQTNHSFNEGLASFLAVDLDNKIKLKNINDKNNWNYKLPGREVEYNLNIVQPSFAGYGGKYPNGNTSQTNESWVVASLIKQLVYGGSKINDSVFWMKNVKDINPPTDGIISISDFINTIKTNKPNNVYEFYNSLGKRNNILNSPTVYKTTSGKDLTIYNLGKDFLLFGFFKDVNHNWLYDTTGVETIGKAANFASFDTKYYDIKTVLEKELINHFSLKSSPYIDKIIGGKSVEKSSYQVDVERTIMGKLEAKKFNTRRSRQEIPPIYSSYLKLNFKDQEKGNVKVDIVFDEPNQDLNYSYDYEINSSEISYLTLPLTYHSKAIISAEGYDNTITIDSDAYWQAMNSDLLYSYMLEATFGEDDVVTPTPSASPTPTYEPTSTPTQTPLESVSPTISPTEIVTQTPTPELTPTLAATISPTQTPTQSTSPNNSSTPILNTNTTPVINVTNENSMPQNNVNGGDTIVLNADNFTDSQKVTVYIDDKKIGEANTLGEKFGLEVKIPADTMIGTKEIKLVDDKGNVATTKIKVSSNNWFNSITIIIISSIIVLILAIVIYKKFKNNTHNIPPYSHASGI